MTAGYLPDANFGYLDEVFKASPPMLNPLLDLLANRVLKMGGQVKECHQLISVLMSSNELPEREDLQAFRDRIGITKMVAPVRTPEGRRAVTDLQLDFQSNGINLNGLKPLTLEDVEAMRAEARQVVVPDALREMMGQAQQKWLEAGHPPSVRRVGQMWKVVKAHAWAAGRGEAGADDLLPCQHMAFNLLEHQDSARAVILEFASAFTRKAERLKQALEPVLAQMEQLRVEIDAAESQGDKEALMDSGFKFLRALRKLTTEADQQIKEGKSQGQDVSGLEGVKTEVRAAYEWAEKALTGTQEDDDA
jgi:MoxR-like ATPase